MTEPSHAVFLSYASQDAEAAQKICEALRAAGIEVFFDQSELRGGDSWDQKIRHEIHDCALFIPMVSQHTQERLEGYFRHEWKLAIERTHRMAEQKPFLVPVVVDGTRDQEAFVPDAFKAVQWTRLPGGDTPPAFVERIRRLLSPELSPVSAVSGDAPAIREPMRASRRSKPVLLAAVALVVLAALAYFLANKFWAPKHATPETAARAGAPPTAFNPPPHSIAVLPFVNLSGDKEQEYFSDGLTEELLNSLAEIDGLQVAARTSSFSFKEHPDIVTVAHKLNVGAVLEGSVRRSANTVRVTAQLINAVTGFHLWSKTYDRDLGDVLRLQTEIATAVASALKVTMLWDVSAKIELGGTRNPSAFDAYLRGLRLSSAADDEAQGRAAIDAYTEALRLDPDYALALSGRSLALTQYVDHFVGRIGHEDVPEQARADAERAVALAPNLAEGHIALCRVLLSDFFEFSQAGVECDRALSLSPGNATVLYWCSVFDAAIGRFDTAIATALRAVALDPLNPIRHLGLGDALQVARRQSEAIAAYREAIAVAEKPRAAAYARQGVSYYLLGNLQVANELCAKHADDWESVVCLALTLNKLGKRSEAEAQLTKLAALANRYGGGSDSLAYQYGQIQAQWANPHKALDWLQLAVRLRDSGLSGLKTDPLMDPLRKEPRFQAIERALKFPN